MKLGRITQRMVNEYPGWSSVRSDEQSLGFQLTNVIGNQIEDIDQQNIRLGKNYFLPTVNLSEIDLVYYYDLGGSFIFSTNEADPANNVFAPPTVTGVVSGSWYGGSGLVTSPVNVTIAPDNDIKSFWYESTPDRAKLGTNIATTHVLLTPTALSLAPLTSFALPHIPGRLTITISGGTKFIALDNNNQIIRGLVCLKGITRKGLEEEETIVFLYNGVKQTLKEWASLSSVRVYGITPSNATIRIESAKFNNDVVPDYYNLDTSPSGNKVDTFWQLGVNTLSNKTLDMVRFTTENSDNLLLGYSQKQVVRQIELLGTSGSAITSLNSITMEPFSNRIWVSSTTSIWVFDVQLPYANMKLLDRKQYDSPTRLELDSYHKVQGDDVEINYIYARPIKEIVKHRASIKYPDGTSYGILNGNTVSISSDYWLSAAVVDRTMRPTHTLNLPQRGDYVLTLETLFLDGSTSVDQRLVSAESLKALKQYNFAAQMTAESRTITGIDFDSDQNLWILDSLNHKQKVDLATDKMLLDYEQKVIYFKESYSNVTVIA